METTDHLARAADYLAIAESADAKREAYIMAADAVIAWLAEDPRRTLREAGQRLGKTHAPINRLVKWRTSGATAHTPYADDRANREARGVVTQDETAARKVLLSPRLARRLLADPAVRAAVHAAMLATEPVRQPVPAPPLDALGGWRRAMRAIGNAFTDVRVAGELVTSWGREWEAGELSADQREALVREVDSLTDSTQALSQAVNSPTDEQFAAFLASLPGPGED